MSSGLAGRLARMASQPPEPPPVGPPDPANPGQPYPPGPAQPYPPHPGQPYVHYVPVVAVVQGRSTSGAAVVALIVGLFLRWCSLWVPSLGMGATHQGRRSGRGMAGAGLVFGYLVVAVTVLVVAVAPEAVANALKMFVDFGVALVDFFGSLVSFVGGPFA